MPQLLEKAPFDDVIAFMSFGRVHPEEFFGLFPHVPKDEVSAKTTIYGVDYVWVHADTRRRSLASKMFCQMASHAVEQSRDAIVILVVSRQNEAAFALYELLGFSKYDTRAGDEVPMRALASSVGAILALIPHILSPGTLSAPRLSGR